MGRSSNSSTESPARSVRLGQNHFKRPTQRGSRRPGGFFRGSVDGLGVDQQPQRGKSPASKVPPALSEAQEVQVQEENVRQLVAVELIRAEQSGPAAVERRGAPDENDQQVVQEEFRDERTEA